MNPETNHCACAFLAAARLRRWGRRTALAAVFFAATTTALHAHRPHEATADFRWLHGRWEAQVVLPLPMATRLLADPELPALRIEDVPAQRARLAAVAEKLFAARGPGATAVASGVNVALSAEGEIAVTFFFPSPAAAPGTAPAPLSLTARFLHELPAEAFCLLRMWPDPDAPSSTHLLVRSAPRADFPESKPAVRPAAAAPAGTAP